MSMTKRSLRDFKFSGIYNSYKDKIKYDTGKPLSYEEFLELILEGEITCR